MIGASYVDLVNALEAVYDNSMDMLTENYLDSSTMIEYGKYDESMMHNINVNATLLIDNMKKLKELVEAFKMCKAA
jgi:hypothetical protein